jgi:hypothetical protein
LFQYFAEPGHFQGGVKLPGGCAFKGVSLFMQDICETRNWLMIGMKIAVDRAAGVRLDEQAKKSYFYGRPAG